LRAGALTPLGYVTLITAGAALNSHDLPWRAALRLPQVYATMHMSWGAGFLLSGSELREQSD